MTAKKSIKKPPDLDASLGEDDVFTADGHIFLGSEKGREYYWETGKKQGLEKFQKEFPNVPAFFINDIVEKRLTRAVLDSLCSILHAFRKRIYELEKQMAQR
jgi:hypothetical protein